jgi:hypothetical protein
LHRAGEIGDDGIAWNLGNLQFQFATMAMDDVFAIGDVNNYCNLDFDHAVGKSLNKGNQQFTLIANNGVPVIAGDVAALADFNGDGKQDIAITMPSFRTASDRRLWERRWHFRVSGASFLY